MQKIHLVYLCLALSMVSYHGSSQGLLNTDSSRGAGWLRGHLPDSNTRLSVEMGTGFTSLSTGGSIFGNYISPHLEYDVSPSFTIIAGGSFSFNQYNNMPQSLVVNNNTNYSQQGLTDHSLFMSGRYMINENLFMTGTVYREQGHMPTMLMNRGVLDYSNQGMSMGVEYRVSNNIRFGAEVGVNRTNNPYHYFSPFTDPFHNRPGRSRHRMHPF